MLTDQIPIYKPSQTMIENLSLTKQNIFINKTLLNGRDEPICCLPYSFWASGPTLEAASLISPLHYKAAPILWATRPRNDPSWRAHPPGTQGWISGRPYPSPERSQLHSTQTIWKYVLAPVLPCVFKISPMCDSLPASGSQKIADLRLL